MRIAFVIHSLRTGGAERAVSSMAGYWAEAGHECVILTLSESRPAFPIDPRVRVLSFRSGYPKPLKLLPCLLWLRANVSGFAPDALLSFTDSVNVIACMAGLSRLAPLVACERIHPEFHTLDTVIGASTNDVLRRLANRVRLFAYRAPALITVQSERSREWFPEGLRGKVVVVPNAIFPLGEIARPAEPRAPAVVGMGRLVPQKRFDLLIRAFAEGAPPEWCLRIYGEGPLERELRAIARESGIESRVDFCGIARPEEAFGGADLFVLSSDFEGWPNALAEAMAAGRAVIATDCPTGPRELVADGENGLLVGCGDVAALAGAISRLAGDRDLGRRLGEAARARASELTPERVMPLWEELVKRARRNAPGTKGGRGSVQCR